MSYNTYTVCMSDLQPQRGVPLCEQQVRGWAGGLALHLQQQAEAGLGEQPRQRGPHHRHQRLGQEGRGRGLEAGALISIVGQYQ